MSVGKALYDLATVRKIVGRRHEIFPLNIGISEKVVYWSQAVVAIEGRLAVPFIDPRRTSTCLTAAARRFVFSVMHERCAADPDLSDIGLCIVQFTASDDRSRTAGLQFSDGIELFSFDALDTMVQETYAIWNEVWAERGEARRRGTGTAGPLL